MSIRVWLAQEEKVFHGISELNFPEDLNTFDAITMSIPSGAYTTFRTYGHINALRLDEHLRRLDETARLAGVPVRFDPEMVCEYVRWILIEYPQELELRIRIVIDLSKNPGDMYLMSEELKIPSEKSYQEGVKLVTCDMRRRNPKAKLTRSIPMAQEIRSGFAGEEHEALMVDPDGRILEGLTSYFFALNGGELWTNEGSVLSGVTRSLVIDTLRDAGLKINFESVTTAEIPLLQEAFITSSSRAILPVVEIDSQQIGDGKPGVVTRRLMGELEERIYREIQPI